IASLVRYLAGSFSGVVGLPLFETAQLLRAHGYSIP
ncbi:MAG: Maf family protein, partial [Proteobacteria bacterium]|nr:Maf family protein [Pseudomonadota bacterium]